MQAHTLFDAKIWKHPPQTKEHMIVPCMLVLSLGLFVLVTECMLVGGNPQSGYNENTAIDEMHRQHLATATSCQLQHSNC